MRFKKTKTSRKNTSSSTKSSSSGKRGNFSGQKIDTKRKKRTKSKVKKGEVKKSNANVRAAKKKIVKIKKPTLSEARKMFNQLTISQQIGKNGVTENTLKKISELLKQKRIIKVKMLQSISRDLDIEEIIEDICNRTKSTFVKKVGNTFCLLK